MSGPKTSTVYISPERQAYLERLRREKAQIIFEIKSKLQRLNNFDIRINDSRISNRLKLKLDAFKKIFKETLDNMTRNANITNNLSTLEALNRNSTDVLNEFEDKYENIFKNIEDNINKIIEVSSRNEKDEIASLIDKIPTDKIEGSRSIILEIKDTVNRIIKINNVNTKDFKKFEFKETKVERKENNEAFDFSNLSKKDSNKTVNFSNLSKKDSNETVVSNDNIEIIVKEILEDLTNFLEAKEYIVKYRQQIFDMRNQILELEREVLDLDIKKKLILEKKVSIKNELKKIEFENKKVEALYEDYLKEAYSIDYSNIKSIKDFSSNGEIKNETEILRKKAQSFSEKNYIREQVDEVISKYGYNMISPEYIEKSNKKNRLLYQVDNSTGIEVFMSDTEQQMFTFKVVGIGFDEELNEKESDRLYEEQCNFCSMYPELINELKTRGIIFEKVNYNEPDRKYNTKIKLKNNFENRNNKRKSKENTNKVKYREIGGK